MTQKLWSAKTIGDSPRDLIVSKGGSENYWDVHTYESFDASWLTDLTELETHKRGEGVWVEGFTPAYLEDMVDFAEHVCKTNGFQNSERDFKKLRSVLAQLSQPQASEEAPGVNEAAYRKIVDFDSQPKFFEQEVSASEEVQPELTKCPRPDCKSYFLSYDEIIAHIADRHPSPAKTGIELTEDEVSAMRDLIDYITLSDRQTISDKYSPKAYNAIYLLKSKLTPAPMDEPTEFVKATIRAEVNYIGDVWGEADFVPVKYGDKIAWINQENAQPYRWNELRNPTRIGGGEK